MAIIYSYPTITNLETTDLFIISRLPEDPEEISNYSVTLNSLSTYIIDKAFNGTDNYIPKFDGTASLVNSIIYQDDDGHVGIGVPGSTPNPVHKFEVYDDRSENVSSDYTQVNSTVVGPPWTGGAGGVLSRLSTDGGSTFPYGISLIPGTTASDLAASGRLAFLSNSNLDTSSATGYSGQVTFDGANPHWILGGNLTDTTTRTLHVKGDMLVDTDLEVDGGLDVAGTVRLGFTGNDPVILGNPTGKRTEWNNPGYFEIYAENPFSPGDFNETVDIDGEYYGGGFIGVYPANTENAHGVRMHVITDPSSASWGSGFTSYFHNFIDIAKANRPSSGANEQNIRISDVYSVRTTGEVEDYAGIKINHPTENRFRFNSEFNTEPTVPFLVNSSSKFTEDLTISSDTTADKKLIIGNDNGAQTPNNYSILDITGKSSFTSTDTGAIINLNSGGSGQARINFNASYDFTSKDSYRNAFVGYPGGNNDDFYIRQSDSTTPTNYAGFVINSNHVTLQGEGIRIGGQGVANELDDYEEGTFNLQWAYASVGSVDYYDIDDFGGVDGSTKLDNSRYVKVGRQVTVTSEFRYQSIPSAWTDTSALIFLKLPFTVATGYYGNGTYRVFPGITGTNPSLFPTNYSIALSLLGFGGNTSVAFGQFDTIKVSQLPPNGPSNFVQFLISFSFYTTD